MQWAAPCLLDGTARILLLQTQLSLQTRTAIKIVVLWSRAMTPLLLVCVKWYVNISLHPVAIIMIYGLTEVPLQLEMERKKMEFRSASATIGSTNTFTRNSGDQRKGG